MRSDARNWGVRVPCIGKIPSGLSAWLEDGTLQFSGRLHASFKLGDYIAVAPPRWNRRSVEICCIDGQGSSALLSFTPEGDLRTVRLPRSAIDAVWMGSGWSVAMADAGTGHVTWLGRTDDEGELKRAFSVPRAWKLHGQRRGTSARWIMSRSAVRMEYLETGSGVRTTLSIALGAEWTRWTIRVKGYPAVPAWIKAGGRFNNLWIVLHGGPGLSWDTGIPRWLELAASDEDTIVLLESPGSVGYGGPLFKWGFSDQRTGFTSVVDVLCDRLCRIWPDSRFILAGESDGANLAASCVVVGKTSFDAAILINGEYEKLQIVRKEKTNILFVISLHDDVVDSGTANKLLKKMKRKGMRIDCLMVEDAHRWRFRKSARQVATAAVQLLRRSFAREGI